MKYKSIFKKISYLRVLLALTLVLLVGVSLSFSAQEVAKQLYPDPQKTALGDLTIKIVQCPKPVVTAGTNLGNGFQVQARSTFPGPLTDIAVDFILTDTPIYPVPAPFAVYSANYSDNVLLLGGREHISFAGAAVINVPLNGSNTIPADTPPGIYYLGAVVDAGNKVNELNEKNNVHFCKLEVIAGTQGKPDLVISALNFKKVKSGIDSSGKTYWIFNVIITVKNQGAGAAGPFKVLLERKIGPGGTFIQGCATCILDVAGLGAGAALVLPPRQFNNANGMNSTFKATADSTNLVPETNEANNSLIGVFTP